MTSVAFFGNIANNLLSIVRAVRAGSNIDAHLFIDERDNLATKPTSEDPDLAKGYPDWMHGSSYVTPKTMLTPWRAALTKELSDFDISIVSGTGPIYAQFTNRPWFFYATGGDLTVLPFPLRFLDLYAGRHKLGLITTGIWQRRALPRATEIWVPPFPPYVAAIRALSIPPERHSSVYFPLIIDIDRFHPDRPAAAPQAAALRRDHDFVVFHPSRLMIDDRPKLRATGNWKQNDLLLKGFAEFVRRGEAESPVLAMPFRTASADVDTAKRIISELGIGRFVRWLEPSAPEGFARHELIDYYAAADVVADNFGVGWFGSVTLEGFSMGKPVLGAVDEETMAILYPYHPILAAGSVSDVADRLSQLATDPAAARSIGLKGRSWVAEFHSPQAAASVYVEEILKAVTRAGAAPPVGSGTGE